MKTRFDTFDLVCSVAELQKLVGMRVNQIYDIDHRTYLIRLQRSEEKSVLLLESGNRIHTTAFEWPKNTAPSGFSMKMRKHLKNKRLESLSQIGTDRILDLQFGIGQAAYHIILELYDRGNIVLTDHEMTILNILRPHTEADKIRFAVKEKYPLDRAHTTTLSPPEIIREKLTNAKVGDTVKKILNPLTQFGAALIDHVLLANGFQHNCKIGKTFNVENDFDRVMIALKMADDILNEAKMARSKTTEQNEMAENFRIRGFITQKKESKPSQNGQEEFIMTNIDFHPMLLEQFKNQPFKEFDSFDAAVDEYFSTMEGQKLDIKALQQEREALKKLENVRKDHDQRLMGLEKTQEDDKKKAELITRNQTLVDSAILAIQSALANQMSWPEIHTLVNDAQNKGDVVARVIKQLKLDTNHISLFLTDPYEESDEEERLQPMLVDIDLAQSAFSNATRYYNMKRSAAKKQQKTIESHGKALKSAERKTKQTLKEVQAIHSINKARKVYWFEKFYWFISSENYLVIGGRDMQQNELIVKRYLRAGDIYVHADLTGASSVVIKNPSGDPVPPKTLAEAGTMAVTCSVAWEAKVVAGAWWVNHDQVSKTAPTGEYLTTGSFMIRGKKNFLPPCQLILGLGFLFRLEESSIERHKGERRVKTSEDDSLIQEAVDEEIVIEEGDSEDEEQKSSSQLDTIKEEKQQNDSNGDEGSSLFPDTQIKLDLSGPKVKLVIDNKTPLDDKSEEVVVVGDERRARAPSRRVSIQEKPQKEEKKDTTGLKRGQKGKLKKMKEKYKGQDEEDKKLLMDILKPDGAAKEDKKKKRNFQGSKNEQKKKGGGGPRPVQQQQNIDNDDEDPGPGPEVDMLDQLTGKPVEEDELLFAVPVIAPYAALQNYKFKVKLTPGTGKRGKASKTAIAVFLKDKTITPRERDLLKAVKEESIARNIPGKVKISAPQMLKAKKQEKKMIITN